MEYGRDRLPLVSEPPPHRSSPRLAEGSRTGGGALIIGASLDAANELARGVAQISGSTFGWHRFTLPQLAAVLAAPTAAARGVVPVGRLGVEAIVSRTVQALSSGGALGRYARIANAPGFSRAIAGMLTELRLAALTPDVLGRWLPTCLPSFALMKQS